MIEHSLKTTASCWDAIERGEKTFEVRRDDRGFQKGDVLLLRMRNEIIALRREVATLRGALTKIAAAAADAAL